MARGAGSGVKIKGYGDSLNIILDTETPFPDLENELVAKLERLNGFFSDAPIILDVGYRRLRIEDCQKLDEILSDRFGLIISTVRTKSEQTRQSAIRVGWKIEFRRPVVENRRPDIGLGVGKKTVAVIEEKEPPEPVQKRGNNTFLLKGTVRAGQRESHHGNVVVLGDVNPGGEVIAGGDIVVFGALRGVAHAGADGDETAQIVALQLRATQLRIAGCIARAPDSTSKAQNVSEKACIENGKIVVHRFK